MKGKTAFAAFGLFISANVLADDTAAIAAGGINLYSISTKSVTLVKGSPFVPSTPIRGQSTGCSSSATAATTVPTLIQQTQDHSTVYALYEPCQSKDVLVKYKVASTGLSEVTSQITIPFTNMGNHHDAPHSTAQGPQNSLIVYYLPAYSVYYLGAALFNSALNYVVEASGYDDTDGTIMDLTSMQVDPSGKFYYVCASGRGVVRTSVSIYSFSSSAGDVLTSSSASNVDSTLVSRSTDAMTVSAFCPD
jgi:hypothetical protein